MTPPTNKKKKMQIEITRRNPSIPLNVTGAAARMVAAADAKADAVYEALNRAADRLTRACLVPRDGVDATALVEALDAAAEFKIRHEAIKDIALRHQSHSVSIVDSWPLAGRGRMDARDCPRDAAVGYHARLIEAGVSMPDSAGVDTPDYWRDAAARGL